RIRSSAVWSRSGTPETATQRRLERGRGARPSTPLRQLSRAHLEGERAGNERIGKSRRWTRCESILGCEHQERELAARRQLVQTKTAFVDTPESRRTIRVQHHDLLVGIRRGWRLSVVCQQLVGLFD